MANAFESISFRVNGEHCDLSLSPETPLLYVLRNDLGLNSPKYGCGLGECGACTVLVDGKTARSCVLPIGRLAGRNITTLEGLAPGDAIDCVQQAFIDAQAVQCGYCLNGMIMTAKALLSVDPNPSEQTIKQALKHNLCRCGTHMEIIDAVKRAAQLGVQHFDPQADFVSEAKLL